MKSFDFDSIEASTGDFERLPAGPYVVRITQSEDVPESEYVLMTYDIAEGKHTGYYDDEWGKQHPKAHAIFCSYKETAKNMLKGRLEAITTSNPGFDAMAAWNAGRPEMFVGRLVGVNLQEEEYENQGEVRTRLSVCAVVDAQKVRNGEVKARPKKVLKKSASKPATAASTVTDEDIPF